MATLPQFPPGPPYQPPPPKRTPGLTAALIAAIVIVVAGVAVALTLALSSDSAGPKPVPTVARTTPSPAPVAAAVSESQVRSLLARYSSAYSSEDLSALSGMFAPSFTRLNDGDPSQDRAAALRTYADQFSRLTSPSYRLSDLSVSPSGQNATATGRYRIESAAGTVNGAISFRLQVTGGTLMITHIETTPVAGPTPAPSPEPAPQPRPSPAPGRYATTASISAWFTTWSGSYIHFKVVGEDSHKTVMEQPGSDNIDLDEEQAAVRRTPERERLVNALRARMEAAGWTEIGTVSGGEWYEYRFGR